MRGLAILGVLLFHFVAPTNPKGPIEGAITWLFSYGALGVDLFFILSGFLITGIVFDSHSQPYYFRNFYMRRVLQIFPPSTVCSPSLLCRSCNPRPRTALRSRSLRNHQAWAWLYGVNIYLAIHGSWAALSYITHFWSLAIEEQFYLVWPLVVWLLAARPRLFLTFSLAAAITSFASRIAASLLGVSLIATTVLTPRQLDSTSNKSRNSHLRSTSPNARKQGPGASSFQ